MNVAHARPRETIYCTDRESFLEPVPPAMGAPISDVVAYMRARNDYLDRITEASNRSFAHHFRRAL